MKKAEAQGRLIIKDVIADNFLQQLLISPKDYSVVATLNLNGITYQMLPQHRLAALGLRPAPISIISPAMLFLRLLMALRQGLQIQIP